MQAVINRGTIVFFKNDIFDNIIYFSKSLSNPAYHHSYCSAPQLVTYDQYKPPL